MLRPIGAFVREIAEREGLRLAEARQWVHFEYPALYFHKGTIVVWTPYRHRQWTKALKAAGFRWEAGQWVRPARSLDEAKAVAQVLEPHFDVLLVGWN